MSGKNNAHENPDKGNFLFLLWANGNRSIVRLSMRDRIRTTDYIFGGLLGIIFVILVGKLLHPDMPIVEILKIIVRSKIWWAW